MLEEILDALSDRVVRYCRASLQVRYCNRSWAEPHGAEPHELVGRRLADLLSPAELDGLGAQLALADSERRFRQLAEHASDVVDTDAVGRDPVVLLAAADAAMYERKRGRS